MTPEQWLWAQDAVRGVTWAFSIGALGNDLYTWSQGRDTSLVTGQELIKLLANATGGNNEHMGGPAVG
jgi:hypothetical protein